MGDSAARCPEWGRTQGCDGTIPPPSPKGGRPRRYCSDRCREAAKYRRKTQDAPVTWQTLGELEELLPADPAVRHRQALDAVARLLAGEPAGAPEDQLARTLLEVSTIVWRLRRLEADLPATLAGRSGGLSLAITRGVREHFPELVGEVG